MDHGYPQYIPICLPRGGGKTALAIAWAAHQLSIRGVSKLLVASHCRGSTQALRLNIIDQTSGRPAAAVVGASPQKDERNVFGRRFDAAVIDNADLFPRVDDGTTGGLGVSVLIEEILAYTHGPIFFTYTHLADLPLSLRRVI